MAVGRGFVLSGHGRRVGRRVGVRGFGLLGQPRFLLRRESFLCSTTTTTTTFSLYNTTTTSTMSSAAARADARKKAILGRGSDRLARLASSARGEEAARYLQSGQSGRPQHRGPSTDPLPESTTTTTNATPAVDDDSDDKPLPSVPPSTNDAFRASPSPPPFSMGGQSDPSVWTEEHQRQFLQALMSTSPGPSPFTQSQPAGNDPFSMMMARMAQTNQGPGSPPPAQASTAPATATAASAPRPLQNLMSLLHFACMWCLLAYFVLWKEPHILAEKTAATVDVSIWSRWQTLLYQRPDEIAWSVHLAVSQTGIVSQPRVSESRQPFFWTFMTVQVMLHSLRIFSGHVCGLYVFPFADSIIAGSSQASTVARSRHFASPAAVPFADHQRSPVLATGKRVLGRRGSGSVWHRCDRLGCQLVLMAFYSYGVDGVYGQGWTH